MLFAMDDQVHHFKVNGEIGPGDLSVLRKSLFRFLDGLPSFTILDLSEASLQIPDFEFQKILVEIQTLAKAKALNLIIAQTDIESKVAKQSLLEMALQKQVEILKGKLALREEMRTQLELLIDENNKLKGTISDRIEKLKGESTRKGPFAPLVEKLWGEP
jgi:hypothetical protein